MRPGHASAAILVMSAAALLSARSADGSLPLQLPEHRFADPLPAELASVGKVKRNVRTSEETRVVYSSTGYTLQILPGGAVNATYDNGVSPYAVMNITLNKTIKQGIRRYYTFRGVASGRYLCLSKKRQAFSSKYLRQNQCRFRVVPMRQFFIIYLYERRQDRRLQLSISKRGNVRVRTIRTRKRRRLQRQQPQGLRRPSRKPLSADADAGDQEQQSAGPASRSISQQAQTRRQQRAHRRAQRRAQRRQRRRQQRLERQQRRQRRQRHRRPTRVTRRADSREAIGRSSVPSVRVRQGSAAARRRRYRGRYRPAARTPPDLAFSLRPVSDRTLHEALRLERKRLAAFTARCRSGDWRSDDWQRRTCGTLRVKRFSAEPPRLTTQPPPPQRQPVARRTQAAESAAGSDSSDDSGAGRSSDSRGVSVASDARDRARPAPPPPPPHASRLDCSQRWRPEAAARCRLWRAMKRKYRLFLQYRHDLRRHGLV